MVDYVDYGGLCFNYFNNYCHFNMVSLMFNVVFEGVERWGGGVVDILMFFESKRCAEEYREHTYQL